MSKFVPNNDLPSYLADMQRDGTWGDHIVLYSLANALGRTIRVVSSVGGYQDIMAPHHSAPILLGHVSEKHYLSLEPRNVSGI